MKKVKEKQIQRWPFSEVQAVGDPRGEKPDKSSRLFPLSELPLAKGPAERVNLNVLLALKRLLARWPDPAHLTATEAWARAVTLKPQQKKSLEALANAAVQAGFQYVEIDTDSEVVYAAVREGYLARLTFVPEFGEYRDWRDRLRDGWSSFIGKAFDTAKKQPNVVVLGGELHARPIAIVPIAERDDSDDLMDFSLGDVMIQTAWSRQLTVRPCFVSPQDQAQKKVTIWLNPLTALYQVFAATLPPSIATLETSLNAYHPPLNFKAGAIVKAPERREVGKLLDEIMPRCYSGIAYDVHPHVNVQLISYDPPVGSTLVNILDGIALRVNAHWDWYGDRVLIVPRPGFEGIR